MDTGIVDIAAYSRGEMQFDIHELMNPKLRKPLTEESCSLTFPHQCRLHGGKVEGSWEKCTARRSAHRERGIFALAIAAEKLRCRRAHPGQVVTVQRIFMAGSPKR